MHDDIADVVLSDKAQHCLEARPVCGASRRAGVGELLNDVGSELPNLASAGITLRRDGIALRFAVFVGLS